MSRRLGFVFEMISCWIILFNFCQSQWRLFTARESPKAQDRCDSVSAIIDGATRWLERQTVLCFLQIAYELQSQTIGLRLPDSLNGEVYYL